jgi:hypothetical protein
LGGFLIKVPRRGKKWIEDGREKKGEGEEERK